MNLKMVYKVEDIKSALELLEEYKDRGRLIAGGTDLIIKLKEKRLRPEVLIDISDISEIKGIEEVIDNVKNINEIKEIEEAPKIEDISKIRDKRENIKSKVLVQIDGLEVTKEDRNKFNKLNGSSDIGYVKELRAFKIGAATTFASIAKTPLFQSNLRGLAEAARSIGSPQIRNTATIGGNICNASPAADIIPPLLALDAIVTIKGKEEEEALTLESFLLDKGKVKLKSNQMLASIAFEKPNAKQSLGFAKLGLRKALAISRIAVAVFLDIEEDHFKRVKVATGACGKLALREDEVEAFLENKAISDQTIEEASELYKTQIEARLKGRIAAEYKAAAIKGVFIEALCKALSYQNK